jgi:hypothetical protein
MEYRVPTLGITNGANSRFQQTLRSKRRLHNFHFSHQTFKLIDSVLAAEINKVAERSRMAYQTRRGAAGGDTRGGAGVRTIWIGGFYRAVTA